MKKFALAILGILTGISVVLLVFMLFMYQNLEDANLGYPIPKKTIENRELSTPFPKPKWEERKEEATQEKGETISFVFGGDVNLHRFQDGYKSKGAVHMIAQEHLDFMKAADFTMVNQEFPFSTRGEAIADKTYTFREDPALVTVFPDLGVDMVSLANNHTLDFGRDALEDTLVTLENAKLPYGGAGRNYSEAKTLRTFDIKGRKLGVLCASRVIPDSGWNATSTTSGLFTTYEPKGLLKAIEEAKTKCDLVVVYVHWGVERQELPEDYQKSLAKQYIDSGADIVIGAHPHIWQGIEFYKGKPIAYSLGNLIFSNTLETGLLKVDVAADNQMSLTIVPLERSGLQLVSHSNKQQFLQHIQSISFGVAIGEDGKVTEVTENGTQ